jgi:hypothetical protein
MQIRHEQRPRSVLLAIFSGYLLSSALPLDDHPPDADYARSFPDRRGLHRGAGVHSELVNGPRQRSGLPGVVLNAVFARLGAALALQNVKGAAQFQDPEIHFQVNCHLRPPLTVCR